MRFVTAALIATLLAFGGASVVADAASPDASSRATLHRPGATSHASPSPSKTSRRAHATMAAPLAAGAAVGCTQWGGYPWVQGGCFNAGDINAALNMIPSSLPPQNAFGQGAGQGFFWLNNSTGATTPTLMQCVSPSGCSTTY